MQMKQLFTNAELEKKAKVFKALAEPIRLQILTRLAKEDSCLCICDIAEHIKKDQSVAFRHIKILKEVDLVSSDKVGKHLMCCVKDKTKLNNYLKL